MGSFYLIAEIELHQLFIHAAETLKSKHGLNDQEISEVTKQLQHVYTKYPWRSLDVYDGVDYDDIKKCCGYLQRYATCHAALTRFATCWFLEQTSLILLTHLLCRRHCLRVVSAGGGPGNDLLGFCSAIQGVPWRNFRRLDLTVVDQKGGWEEVFDEVMTTARFPKLRSISFLGEVQVAHRFVRADLARECGEHIEKADLILMVKVLSNVTPSQKPLILEKIFSSMKPGSIFLYVDIDALRVQEKAIHTDGMQVICTKTKDIFKHSVGAPLIEMISYSTYEICALYKNKY